MLRRNWSTQTHFVLANQILKQTLQIRFRKTISCSCVSTEAKYLNKKLVQMIAIGYQQFLAAEDEGSLRLAQAINPRYRFLLENKVPATLLNYILLWSRKSVTGLHAVAGEAHVFGITQVEHWPQGQSSRWECWQSVFPTLKFQTLTIWLLQCNTTTVLKNA